MDESSGRAIRRLRSIFWSERDPEGRAFPTLADAYRRAGDLDQALELLADGLDRHPTFATGHVVAAWVHRDRSDLQAAEASFRRVLELDEENVQALHGLGKILVVRGEVQEAQALLTRAAELGAATEADLAPGATPPQEPDAEEDFPTDTGAEPPPAVDEAGEGLPATGVEASSLEPGTVEVGAGDMGAGQVSSGDQTTAEAVADEVVEIAALAPDAAEEVVGEPAGPAEPDVVEIADLAPDEPVPEGAGPEAPVGGQEPPAMEETDVVEIADLAPDPAAAVADEPVVSAERDPVDIGDLAPDDLAGDELAPDELAADDLATDDLARDDLAPDEAQPHEAPAAVDDEAAEAPDVIDIGMLAPDEAPAAADDDAPVVLETADAAPDETVQEEVVHAEMGGEDVTRDEGADEGEEEGVDEGEGGDEAPVVAVGAEVFRAAADEPYDGPRTRTMAELYARQGLMGRAVDIYEHLLRERPEDREVRSRLEELRARSRGEEPGVEEDMEAMAREMSTGDHAESTPSPFTWAEEAPSDVGEEEPPISAWFGELLTWQPGARPREEEPPPQGDTLSVPGDDR